MKHYVYRHYIDDITLYVGKGSGNRAYDKNNRSEAWNKELRNKDYKIEIVKHFATAKEAYEYEGYLTNHYKSIGQCKINVSIGAKTSEETKIKMRLNHANVKGENNPNFGKKASEETREKMALAKTGKNLSENTKDKISQTLKNNVDNKSRRTTSMIKDGKVIKEFSSRREANDYIRNNFMKDKSFNYIRFLLSKSIKEKIELVGYNWK